MSKCGICGGMTAERCQEGMITYLSGLYGCPKNPEHPEPKLHPDFIIPALLTGDPDWAGTRFSEPVAAPDVDLWTVEPAPSAAGLEDLLGG